ncbi:MAG: O-methyltransferase [Clostridia bacterium]
MFDENIRKYGQENKVPITLDDTLSFLIKTINDNDSKEILEIGTAIGYGSISMATHTNCAHIDTVEKDEARYKIAIENVKLKGLEDKISIYLMDAFDYITNNNKKYDLIYLDGPKGQYINYLAVLTKLLNKGGIIFADNLHFHGMVTGEVPVSRGCRAMIKGLHRYIDEITNNPIYDTTIYNIGDGVGVTIKKTD